MTPIQLWHGGNRWEGDPEVRPARQGAYECGPGIYLSTSYETARKYAKGGKVTTLVTLGPTVRLLENALLPLSELTAFLRETPRIKRRANILRELEDVCPRFPADSVPVSCLVNLCVNYDALAGKPGVALAQWLTAKGIDASLHRAYGAEQWLIVFNPKVILRHEVVAAKDVSLADYDLPMLLTAHP